ncbi:hypothetical protein D9611_008325 [Ephemerocybe angulata]|uniref:Uncharacterized protein n=1 Tax=Ephemerocybe angulata TaxID=980116 RepID=A0A8H5BJ10_9AGAR|nr:hypothetical protein D9611_008325 [Tulosesus angulatus]
MQNGTTEIGPDELGPALDLRDSPGAGKDSTPPEPNEESRPWDATPESGHSIRPVLRSHLHVRGPGDAFAPSTVIDLTFLDAPPPLRLRTNLDELICYRTGVLVPLANINFDGYSIVREDGPLSIHSGTWTTTMKQTASPQRSVLPSHSSRISDPQRRGGRSNKP